MAFKKGDYIYYYKKVDNTFDTIPAKVLAVHKVMLTILCNGVKMRVHKKNCEHQTP